MATIAPIPPPPAAKRQPTEARRRAIAMAARQLIVEKGFEGLRTRDIADRVGINIATLHYHVPSKEALIALVAESLCAEFRAQREKRARPGLSPLQQLRLQFDGYRETLDTRPDLIHVFAELLIRARRDDTIRALIEPQLDHWVGQLDEILKAGVADGSFRPGMDTRAAAYMITAALQTLWRDSDQLAAFERVADELERAVINPTLANKDQTK